MKFIRDLLDGNKEKAIECVKQLSTKKQEEIIVNFSSNEEQIDNIYELIEQCEAKKIHEYYQTKKNHDFLLLKKEVTNEAVGCWKLQSGKIITTKKAKLIGKFKGKNCYGLINEKLENKIGTTKFNIFKKVLEDKGIIFKKIAQNGVKFLKNAFEIKIDDEERIYTNQIYKNQEEELLLNFDHHGSHREVKDFLVGHNLEFHPFS